MRLDRADRLWLNGIMLTKQDFSKIKLLLKDHPTKDELFKRLDHIVGELETIRTEQLILTHSQTEHENRYNHTPLQSITPAAS